MEYIRLSDCAFYRNERTNKIDCDTYISTENMLPNRAGITVADALPDAINVSKYLPNDILLSNIRPYFKKIWFANREGGCSNDILVVASKQNILASFLYYVLSDDTFFHYSSVTSKGTKMPRGTPNAIMKYPVPHPDEHDQQRIVSILSAYDNLIEVNKKRIKVLEQMAENLYKEWFVRFRFPGHESVPFENGLPTSWRKARITDFVSFLKGFAFKSEDYDDAGRYIVATIKNVQDGYFDLSNVERIDFLPTRMPQYCMLKKGDVIMSLTGNVGRVCIVSSDGCLLNQRVCKIESKYPLFAYLFFRQEAVFQTLCNIAYGTAQLNLSPILTGRMRTVLPPEHLMACFDEKVSALYEQIQSYREQSEILIKQRDLLLPRLMSGKLEV